MHVPGDGRQAVVANPRPGSLPLPHRGVSWWGASRFPWGLRAWKGEPPCLGSLEGQGDHGYRPPAKPQECLQLTPSVSLRTSPVWLAASRAQAGGALSLPASGLHYSFPAQAHRRVFGYRRAPEPETRLSRAPTMDRGPACAGARGPGSGPRLACG